MNLVEIYAFIVTRLWLSSNCASSKSSRFGDRRGTVDSSKSTFGSRISIGWLSRNPAREVTRIQIEFGPQRHI